MINFIGIGKVILPFFIPSGLNIFTHFICEYMGCHEWYSLLGYNLACNSCIDIKKLLKDHQMSLLMWIGGNMVSKTDNLINNILSNN